MSYFQIRTDLALEAREFVQGANGALHGIIVEEYVKEEGELHVTKVQITTKNGSKILGKPMGTYITLEIPGLCEAGENSEVCLFHKEIAKEISSHLKDLLPERKKNMSILIVGLGNREVTADALGPQVVEQLLVNRHIIKEYGAMGSEGEEFLLISAIVPGVMAKTGMESAEIVKGIVKETLPDVVLVIDALAARSIRRLNRTIQLSNTGIHPGSGVGNHRNAIDSKSLKIPVIAIGVPTVVDAATIVSDAMEKMYKERKEAVFLQARESMVFGELNNMYVTPKDIDITIKRVSHTLAEALNLTFSSHKDQ
ncbi:MAG: GPR endopeptidase [Lachnospiraceae bacterium]|nr:GPR endopeptidase [Lachnospiraceae bacterium]